MSGPDGVVGIGFAAGLILTVSLTPAIRRLALHLDWVDRPAPPVKIQERPIPVLGGAALLAGLVGGLACAFAAVGHPGPRLLVILACSLAIAVIGLVDDLRDMGPWLRLGGQTAIAWILLARGVRLELVFLPPWLSVVLTLLWVVGLTNAVNFLDVLDGLAAGVVALAALGLAAIAVLAGQPAEAIPASTLAGACLGFLWHNFAPARIYLGDMGSTSLGFLIAALALETRYPDRSGIFYLAPVVILWIPILDAMMVTMLRIARGSSPLRASPDHLALRLAAAGFGRRGAVRILWLVALGLAVAGGAIPFLGTTTGVVISTVLGLLSLIAGVRLGRIGMGQRDV